MWTCESFCVYLEVDYSSVVKCTACHSSVNHNDAKAISRHAALDVLICKVILDVHKMSTHIIMHLSTVQYSNFIHNSSDYLVVAVKHY